MSETLIIQGREKNSGTLKSKNLIPIILKLLQNIEEEGTLQIYSMKPPSFRFVGGLLCCAKAFMFH